MVYVALYLKVLKPCVSDLAVVFGEAQLALVAYC